MNIENGRLKTSFSQLRTLAVLIREQGKFTKHPYIYTGALHIGANLQKYEEISRLFESGSTEIHTKSIKPLKIYLSGFDKRYLQKFLATVSFEAY